MRWDGESQGFVRTEGHGSLVLPGRRVESWHRVVPPPASVLICTSAPRQGSIVFVSDSEAELQAARTAGVGWPVMCCRPGNKALTTDSCGFAAVRSLMELCRRKDE